MYPNNHPLELKEIPCQFCNRKIVATNHQLHESRCAIMSSRMRNQAYYKQSEKRQQPSQIYRPSQIKRQSFMPNQRSELEPRSRQKIFNNQPKQQEAAMELIPCSNCGHMQTFAELDTHPQVCAHQEIQCRYCKSKFPSVIMEEHEQMCPAKQQIQQPIMRFRPQLPRRNYFQSSEQDQQHPHPFNSFSINSQHPRIIQRSITTINGRTLIEEIDQQGNVRRRQSDNINNQNNGNSLSRRLFYQPFGNLERGGMFGNRNHAFADFFRLLEHISGQGQGHQAQGLTKQQIKNLERRKFKKPVGKIEQNQKQLCTICYCEFQQNQNIVNLRCKHLYHEECIVKWLQNNAKCPVCKAPQTNRQISNVDD